MLIELNQGWHWRIKNTKKLQELTMRTTRLLSMLVPAARELSTTSMKPAITACAASVKTEMASQTGNAERAATTKETPAAPVSGTTATLFNQAEETDVWYEQLGIEDDFKIMRMTNSRNDYLE